MVARCSGSPGLGGRIWNAETNDVDAMPSLLSGNAAREDRVNAPAARGTAALEKNFRLVMSSDHLERITYDFRCPAL